MKKKLFMAIIMIMVLSGCVSPRQKEIDRGKIPNPTNPIMPPSLTNEWKTIKWDGIIIEEEGYNDFVMVFKRQ